MLQYQTIDAETLELLRELQNEHVFKELRLVGGTSLALQIGHRKSVDIDLFGKLSIDRYGLTEVLSRYKQVELLNSTGNIYSYLINGIKVDLVNYPYPWISEKIESEGLILADIKDICALKLAAITGRGTKKDFIDIFYLLKQFTLKEMLSLYKQKFFDGSEFLVIKSLAYFEDAETEIEPIMLQEYDWNRVKQVIIDELEKYTKSIK